LKSAHEKDQTTRVTTDWRKPITNHALCISILRTHCKQSASKRYDW